MKKVYLGAIMASFSLGVFAQVTPTKQAKKHMSIEDNISEPLQVRNNIWTETFGGIGTSPLPTEGPSWTTSNGVWTASGTNGDIWKHSFAGSTGQYGNPAAPGFSTSADGFMIFDSDSANGSNGEDAFIGELISPQIDLTNETSALLVFEQDFRYCCSNNPLNISVAVSSDDGTTWSAPIPLSIGVGANDTYEGIYGTFSKSANITPLAAGNTVRLKFTWDGTTNNSGFYFWAIDDICITQAPDNELVGFGEYFGSQAWTYHQIPVDQIQPINFYALCENLGNLTQTEVKLNVDIDNGAFTTTSPAGVSYAPALTDTLFAQDTYTPPSTVGSHTLSWNISQTETDGTPANNTFANQTFEVNEFIYARDNNTAESNIWNQAQGYEVGAMYDLVNEATIYAVDAVINGFTASTAQVYGKVYEVDFTSSPVSYNLLEQSDYKAIPNSSNDQLVTFVLLSPVTLEAGKSYLVTVGSDGNGGQGNDLVVSLAQPLNSGAVWYNAQSTNWSGMSNTPMVRMNFDNTVGIEENTLEGVAIFPNPTTGVITISNDNQTDNKIEVRDLAGKLVASTSAAIETTIDLTGNPSGIYMVKVYNENGATIEKVTLK